MFGPEMTCPILPTDAVDIADWAWVLLVMLFSVEKMTFQVIVAFKNVAALPAAMHLVTVIGMNHPSLFRLQHNHAQNTSHTSVAAFLS